MTHGRRPCPATAVKLACVALAVAGLWCTAAQAGASFVRSRLHLCVACAGVVSAASRGAAADAAALREGGHARTPTEAALAALAACNEACRLVSRANLPSQKGPPGPRRPRPHLVPRPALAPSTRQRVRAAAAAPPAATAPAPARLPHLLTVPRAPPPPAPGPPPAARCPLPPQSPTPRRSSSSDPSASPSPARTARSCRASPPPAPAPTWPCPGPCVILSPGPPDGEDDCTVGEEGGYQYDLEVVAFDYLAANGSVRVCAR